MLIVEGGDRKQNMIDSLIEVVVGRREREATEKMKEECDKNITEFAGRRNGDADLMIDRNDMYMANKENARLRRRR
jgi:hypothetical protein